VTGMKSVSKYILSFLVLSLGLLYILNTANTFLRYSQFQRFFFLENIRLVVLPHETQNNISYQEINRVLPPYQGVALITNYKTSYDQYLPFLVYPRPLELSHNLVSLEKISADWILLDITSFPKNSLNTYLTKHHWFYTDEILNRYQIWKRPAHQGTLK
jgi:hypothetical protein